MTYMAGGRQYVAIPVGPSLIGNRVVRQLTPEIPVPGRGSALLVFALPDPDFSVAEQKAPPATVIDAVALPRAAAQVKTVAKVRVSHPARRIALPATHRLLGCDRGNFNCRCGARPTVTSDPCPSVRE